jgi:hypothetical protein
MVCREPKLRYTKPFGGALAPAAMVCREPKLRYTIPPENA